MFLSQKCMLHGSCIVKNAKLYLKSAVLTFCAKEFQVESSVLYQSGNNKYYCNILLMINFTEQVMPIRIFGLFGLHHGLEIELKSQIKESIQEEVFFDYKDRCYEIQSYSLTGSSRYINVRQIPNPSLYPSKKRLEILSEAC